MSTTNVSTINQSPSEEELELMQNYGGHEPHTGKTLLEALREERRQSVVEVERRTYEQRVRVFLAEHAEGSD
ncbi:hypothetical protein HYT95_02735 [Candidatus Peregrinibacteria bacterium]|nr:hypothetical protein [Candidatus Peregrinibacteria bacterium]